MYKKYALQKLKMDFMGYEIKRKEDISFHHLIIPHRDCKKKGLGEGYLEWNGALLVQKTSHDYLHLIESIDYDYFTAISSEMIDENIKGYLDMENIKEIDYILREFEKEYRGITSKKGGKLIKDEYTRRLLRK